MRGVCAPGWSRVWLLIVDAIIPGPNRQILARVVDVTERKWAEEQLQSAMKNLRRANTELEVFANFVAHDLYEPLRKVAGYAQLLARGCQVSRNVIRMSTSPAS